MIGMLLLHQDNIFIDRGPEVFHHILNWMRTGKLYIHNPGEATYQQLCDDADFYLLDDLRKFLANRFNVFRYILLRDAAGLEFRFDLDAFRSTKPAGGFLDKFINDEISSRYLLGRDTIYPEELKERGIRIMCIRCILIAPHIRYDKLSSLGCNYHTMRFLFGDRIKKSTSGDDYDYVPEPRD